MNVCPICKTKKKDSDFYKKISGKLYSYCKDCSKFRVKSYYQKNKKKELKRVAEYDTKNREKKRRKYREWSWKSKIECLEKYGGKCMCCGETEPKFLAIDHKNGNGNKHRKKIGNIKISVWLKRNNYPNDFQILCHNCNMAKGLWGECPHAEITGIEAEKEDEIIDINGVKYKKL